MPPAIPFNPSVFRRSQDFCAATSTKKLLTKIPVRKPAPEWFIRTHPDPAYRFPTQVIELKEDRELYLVANDLADALHGKATLRSKLIVPAVTRQGGRGQFRLQPRRDLKFQSAIPTGSTTSPVTRQQQPALNAFQSFMKTHPHNSRPGSVQIVKTLHELYAPDDTDIAETRHHVAHAKSPIGTDKLRRRRAQLQRRAKRNLRPTAFHEAAHAVVARSYGYRVDHISTYAHTDVRDPLTNGVDDRIGHTQMWNPPHPDVLSRPGCRADAERYIILRLVGPFAEAVARGRQNRWTKSDDLEAVMALVEVHAEWCTGQYLAWLQQRAEMAFFGPAYTEIQAVARKLIRQREMTGTGFRQFLRRRARRDGKQADETKNYSLGKTASIAEILAQLVAEDATDPSARRSDRGSSAVTVLAQLVADEARDQ